MTREEIRQLERMIEIIVRAIPKERAAAKMYGETASKAAREITRMLFSKLHADASQHEEKLGATLEILRKELRRLKSPSAAEETAQVAPSQAFNVHIRQMMRLTSEMKVLAKDGLQDANDPSCRKMYESLLESAVHLRELAEQEIEKHVDKEKWD